MNAVVYARISPKPKPTDASIELQVEACGELATQNHWTIKGTHIDKDLSGGSPDRPGLWAAVDSLNAGDRLLVYRLDRLARSVYLAEGIHREISKSGASVVAVHGGPVDDTPEGRMVRQILDAASEYERRVIRARTSAAMQRHQREGRRMSRIPPFGWQLDPEDPKLLVANPDERAAAKQVRLLRSQGLGWKKIAREMCDLGYPCRGSRWHASTCRSLVENPKF